MKKLYTLVFLALFSSASLAQDLTNQFYFRIGYSSPSWGQYGMKEKFWKEMSYDNRIGATFEMGNIFMLKNILKSPNASFGINADYLYITYGNFSGRWQELNKDQNVGSLRIGSKVGPSFTISPMDKMAIDIYAKADIAWGSVAVMYENEPSDADDYFTGYGTLGFSTGLNFRYGLLILGFEFNTISPKLESDDYPGEYWGNVDDEGDKTDLPCMNFTIGISF